jgi:hypothetical protein
MELKKNSLYLTAIVLRNFLAACLFAATAVSQAALERAPASYFGAVDTREATDKANPMYQAVGEFYMHGLSSS